MSDNNLPASNIAGLVPTKNRTGYMISELDEFSKAFIAYCAPGLTVCDIGPAYGNTTIAALKKGVNIVAVDMEPAHLDVVKKRANNHPNLNCLVAAMPNVAFEHNHFDAILCSRVLHFLRGEDIIRSIAKIFHWLKPGGKFFFIVDTPYLGVWWPKLKAEYEDRKQAGDPWPALMEPFHDYLSPDKDKSVSPDFFNPFDLPTAVSLCQDVGFDIDRSSYINRSELPLEIRVDGRESLGIIAVKPISIGTDA